MIVHLSCFVQKRIEADEQQSLLVFSEVNFAGVNPAVDGARADLTHAGALFGGDHLNLLRAFSAPGKNKSFRFADNENLAALDRDLSTPGPLPGLHLKLCLRSEPESEAEPVNAISLPLAVEMRGGKASLNGPHEEMIIEIDV